MHGIDMCTSGERCRPISCSVNQGLRASVLLCAHQPEYLSYGLSALDRLYFLCLMHVDQATSFQRKKHRPGDTSRGLPHWSKLVHSARETTSVDKLHQPCPMRITAI